MRIGIKVDGFAPPATIEERIGRVRAAAEAGFAAAWSGEPAERDPLTGLALAGREVPGIALGTAIVHAAARHPLALAAQALAVQSATGDRLTLGLGPNATFMAQLWYGAPADRPGSRMREYLSALVPLLRGERVSHQGETLTADGQVAVPGAAPPSLLLGALGPVMLRLAGELADGTVTALSGPRALAAHVVPTIRRAAAAAGRPAPRVVASVTVCVTEDEAAARAAIEEQTGFLAQVPGYRAMLDREGAADVGAVAAVGDEAAVERELRRYADAGATELIASPAGSSEEHASTLALLADLARAEG